MAKPTIYARDKYYIPAEFIPDEIAAREAFTHHFYDDKICKQCAYRHDRHSETCDNCEFGGYQGSFCLASTRRKNGTDYLGVPPGSRATFEQKLGIYKSDFRIKDMRRSDPFKAKGIEFTGKLRDYQEKPVSILIRKKYGLLKAPPRSGKTVMGTKISIDLGIRTIIIADQKDFLDNFYETIMDPTFTNVEALEKKQGRKICGFARTKEDFENLDIALCTYQMFINEKSGKARMKLMNANFGCMIIDEVHSANAACYSQFVSRSMAKIKIGLTGTPVRKDRKHILVEDLVGPVQIDVRVEQLKPKIVIHESPSTVSPTAKYNGPAGWVRAMQYLSRHTDRNKYIIDGLIHDIENGRSVVMACQFKDHVFMFVEAINKHFGKEVAQPFVGGGSKKDKDKRKQIIDDARAGKIKLVVGIRKLLQRGLNVPRWDTLYCIIPISNEPNWKQESSRILTPDDTGTKKAPLIRLFVDPQMGQSVGCFKNTYIQCLKFGYKPTSKAKDYYERNYGKGSYSHQREEAMYNEGVEYPDLEHQARSKKQKSAPKGLGIGRRF